MKPLRFDEDRLRAEIVEKWGPAGAHVDVFDHIVMLARRGQRLETGIQTALTKCDEAWFARVNAAGCCNDDDWRFRFCEFHRGYEDGGDAVAEMLRNLLDNEDPDITDSKG